MFEDPAYFKTIDGYSILEHISEGGTSVVFKVVHNKTKQIAACKIINKDFINEQGTMTSIRQEIEIHKTLDHPNIVKLYKVIEDDHNIYMFMEYCDNGDLYMHIENNFHELSKNVVKVYSQIVLALYYLHGRGIAHGDIKPENILLDEKMNVKLTDFGAAELVDSADLQIVSGTALYLSPEIFSESYIDRRASDVWALGIVLYAMSTGCLPWPNIENEEELTEIVSKGDYIILSPLSRECKFIVELCLTREEDHRPTIMQLMMIGWPKKNCCLQIRHRSSLAASKNSKLPPLRKTY